MLAVAAFLCVAALIPAICYVANRSGFVDTPHGRKQHDAPVPPLGGITLFIIFLIIMIGVGGFPPAVYAALALILVVGIVDDAWEINARLKFGLHFMAAIILVWGGDASIDNLGNLFGFGNIQLGWFAFPFTVACVVYIQNAINMMDGVDGLAGGQCMVIFAGLALAASAMHPVAHQQILIVMGCLAGFLVHNMRSPILKRARIFLGDAGSMALGLMIAWYCITLSQSPDMAIKPVSVAWLIALPIVDSFGLLVTRLREKRPPFMPDQRHIHHHFRLAGFSPAHITLIILTYTIILATIGIVGLNIGVPEYILGWGWVALWIGHTALTMTSSRFVKYLIGWRNKLA